MCGGGIIMIIATDHDSATLITSISVDTLSLQVIIGADMTTSLAFVNICDAQHDIVFVCVGHKLHVHYVSQREGY